MGSGDGWLSTGMVDMSVSLEIGNLVTDMDMERALMKMVILLKDSMRMLIMAQVGPNQNHKSLLTMQERPWLLKKLIFSSMDSIR